MVLLLQNKTQEGTLVVLQFNKLNKNRVPNPVIFYKLKHNRDPNRVLFVKLKQY